MTISGTIRDVIKNDRDDVDGFQLRDGQVVHFPPHMADAITEIAGKGDRISVTGRVETRPEGDEVFEARTIVCGEKSVSIEPPRPKAKGKGKGPGPRDWEPPMNAKGRVTELNTNKHGDVDGFVLKDGTEVKFPPHQADELAALVEVGADVQVEGRRHETPKGDVHLHADRITNIASGETIERDAPPGPKGPGPRPPHEVGSPAGPDPVQREILDELKAIRKMLERRPRAED